MVRDGDRLIRGILRDDGTHVVACNNRVPRGMASRSTIRGRHTQAGKDKTRDGSELPRRPQIIPCRPRIRPHPIRGAETSIDAERGKKDLFSDKKKTPTHFKRITDKNHQYSRSFGRRPQHRRDIQSCMGRVPQTRGNHLHCR